MATSIPLVAPLVRRLTRLVSFDAPPALFVSTLYQEIERFATVNGVIPSQRSLSAALRTRGFAFGNQTFRTTYNQASAAGLSLFNQAQTPNNVPFVDSDIPIIRRSAEGPQYLYRFSYQPRDPQTGRFLPREYRIVSGDTALSRDEAALAFGNMLVGNPSYSGVATNISFVDVRRTR